jgi:O6-methylguanine-DNA--protein-cysteine methyltransferase
VISSAGTLGGFSGGLGMKKRLLDLETHEKGSH